MTTATGREVTGSRSSVDNFKRREGNSETGLGFWLRMTYSVGHLIGGDAYQLIVIDNLEGVVWTRAGPPWPA